MLLVLSDQFDSHADLVQEKLLALGIRFYRLNLDMESLLTTSITFDSEWTIINEFGKLSLSSVTQVWLRRVFVEIPVSVAEDKTADFQIWRGEWNKTLSGMYLTLESALWLNRVKPAFRAENKYYQMMIARKVGLNLPDIMVSNIKTDLIAFAEKHGEVALKLMTQELYVDVDGIKGIYVNKLNPTNLVDFALTGENPIVLQNYIPKKYEVRYTVVGDKHLVCKIESQHSEIARVDWRRYDIPNTPHYAIEPPSEIRSKVIALMQVLELDFGALDFIVSKDDTWYFLEINSMGQWLWIEDLTGLPISDAIVNWFSSYRSAI